MISDVSQFEKFFGLIYGESSGNVAIVTLDDDGTPSSQRWFGWPEQKKAVARYAAVRESEDVYLSVGLFDSEDRKDHNSRARVVYADADTCAPENFRLPPSISVQTSTGHWHAFWVLDEEVSHDRAAELSRKISVAHAHQGCDKGWGHGKILRVPGTTNNKRDVPEPVVATYTGDVYTADTIDSVYHDIDVTPEVHFDSKIPEPITGSEFIDLENKAIDRDLEDLYLKPVEDGESWSERLFRLELELFRKGLNPVEVFSLARNASCNKFNPEHVGKRTKEGAVIPRRSNPDATTWQDVQKAHAEYEIEAQVLPAEDPATNAKSRKDIVRPEFLKDNEREFMRENPTVVDEYVAWASAHTKASVKYHRALAWIVLACAFGGRGKIDLPWYKSTELNMWLMLLGPSTRSHKSTAYNYALSTIRKIEAQAGMNIDIGSDATKEALNMALGKKGGEGQIVSLMHKEEATGWFSELFGAKQFRAGELEALTQLYDGAVPKSLRQNKENSQTVDARVVFNFLAVGIRKRVSEILSRNHFESGFLMRMTWAIADATPRKPGYYSVDFDDDGKPDVYDDRQNLIVRDITTRMKVASLEHPVRIRMDKAAQTRYNRWTDEAIEAAEKYDPDMGEALAARMHGNVMRAAGLLALYNQTETITLRELIPVLDQAEVWFVDMIHMAREVSNSEYERRKDDIRAYIEKGKNGQRNETDIRRTFGRLRPREMAEALEALSKEGYVRELRDNRGVWEAL